MPPRGKPSVIYPFLSEIPMFERLSPETAAGLFKLGRSKVYRNGAVIVQEGAKGGDLYIVVSGKVEVWKSHRGKNRGRKLADLGLGAVFGEMSVFDGSPYSATVKAAGDCVIHTLQGKVFAGYLEKNPKTAVIILRSLLVEMASRLRRMNEAVSSKDS